MSGLKWMARGERPTEPGWYWFRDGSDIAECMLVWERDGVLQWDGYSSIAEKCDEADAKGWSFRWAGPIPEPEDSND